MVPLQILTSHSANATVEDEWIRWLQVANHVDIFIKIIVFRRLFRRDRNTKVFQSVTFSLKRLKHWIVCQYTSLSSSLYLFFLVQTFFGRLNFISCYIAGNHSAVRYNKWLDFTRGTYTHTHTWLKTYIILDVPKAILPMTWLPLQHPISISPRPFLNGQHWSREKRSCFALDLHTHVIHKGIHLNKLWKKGQLIFRFALYINIPNGSSRVENLWWWDPPWF